MYLAEADVVVITRLYACKKLFVDFFRAHPQWLEIPYLVQRKNYGRGWVHNYIADDCRDNAIFQLLCDSGAINGLSEDERSPDMYPEPKFRRDLNHREQLNGYALIDLVVRLIKLLNVFEPNKALFHNTYATHLRMDVFGHEDSTSALRAIERLIKKLRSGPSFEPSPGEALCIQSFIQIERTCHLSTGLSKGLEFERKCEDVLKRKGFVVQRTPMTGDYGADLIAERDELSFAIQCKDTLKPAGVKAVQEAAAARAHYGTDFAVVCSSGGFTDAAINLATSAEVMLSNFDQLSDRLEL